MADVELLPLPEHFAHQSERVQQHVRDYARANLAHATAAQAAEIEALLAEVDALREVLGRILENEASDYKAAEEFGGYVLDDELREEARDVLAQEHRND
jgi:hypothetical protein